MNTVISLDVSWDKLRSQAVEICRQEPQMTELISKRLLAQPDFQSAIATLIASTLAAGDHEAAKLEDRFKVLLYQKCSICESAVKDLEAVVSRDPVVKEELEVFLFSKGFIAIQAYRIGHQLLQEHQRYLALYIQSRSNLVLGIDINPACKIGQGIMLDHGTGIVIGETAEVEDKVSILQGVTLGGTGKLAGDRHPKVRTGVVIGAGAKVLGNIEIGTYATIGASSVVLKPVKANTTVSGVPAKPHARNRYEPKSERQFYEAVAQGIQI